MLCALCLMCRVQQQQQREDASEQAQRPHRPPSASSSGHSGGEWRERAVNQLQAHKRVRGDREQHQSPPQLHQQWRQPSADRTSSGRERDGGRVWQDREAERRSDGEADTTWRNRGADRQADARRGGHRPSSTSGSEADTIRFLSSILIAAVAPPAVPAPRAPPVFRLRSARAALVV